VRGNLSLQERDYFPCVLLSQDSSKVAMTLQQKGLEILMKPALVSRDESLVLRDEPSLGEGFSLSPFPGSLIQYARLWLEDWQAVTYPNFEFFYINGNQDSPNLSFALIGWKWDCPHFRFAEINRYWDYEKLYSFL